MKKRNYDPNHDERPGYLPDHNVKCGRYLVETRLKTSPRKEDLAWTSTDVNKIQILGEGRRFSRGRHYFPWQAEREAKAIMHPGTGNPEVVAGIREVRVRCERLCENLPMGPFSLRLPDTMATPGPEARHWPESQSDGRLWRQDVDLDPEGQLEIKKHCEATGAPLHPVFCLRRFDPDLDLEDLDLDADGQEESKPTTKPKRKRRTKKKSKEDALPKGAMF